MERPVQNIPEEKARLLIEFVEEHRRVPQEREEYKGIKLGGFWKNIKRRGGPSNASYTLYLHSNDILRADMFAHEKSSK